MKSLVIADLAEKLTGTRFVLPELFFGLLHLGPPHGQPRVPPVRRHRLQILPKSFDNRDQRQQRGASLLLFRNSRCCRIQEFLLAVKKLKSHNQSVYINIGFMLAFPTIGAVASLGRVV